MYASVSFIEVDHAPLANLDYGFIWGLKDGETIVGSSWTATTGLVLTNQLVVVNVSSVFAEGGEIGKLYQLTNSVTTSQGRKDSRTIILSCKKR